MNINCWHGSVILCIIHILSKFGCILNRLHHALGVGGTLPGSVKSSPMVYRHPYYGKAKGNIYPGHTFPHLQFMVVPKSCEFCRNMSLVMVHANYNIILSSFHFWEDSIRGMRTIGMDSFLAGRFNGGNNFFDLFPSKQAMFTCMRVQSVH